LTYNTAVYKGGGLFVIVDNYNTTTEKKLLNLSSVVIHYNKAFIGAGINYEGLIP